MMPLTAVALGESLAEFAGQQQKQPAVAPWWSACQGDACLLYGVCGT